MNYDKILIINNKIHKKKAVFSWLLTELSTLSTENASTEKVVEIIFDIFTKQKEKTGKSTISTISLTDAISLT